MSGGETGGVGALPMLRAMQASMHRWIRPVVLRRRRRGSARGEAVRSAVGGRVADA